MIISVSMPVVSAWEGWASTLGTPDRGTARTEIDTARRNPILHAANAFP